VPFYPVFLDLCGRACVVVGNGALAEEKVTGLLHAGAAVTVIAPELSPELENLAEEGRIAVRRRAYLPGDLKGAVLGIVCFGYAQDPETVGAIWREARESGILINTIDDPPHCDFIAPSIVRRGDLAVAISTGGNAPALAVRLRQKLETMLGDEHGRFLALAGAVRARLAAAVPDFGTRRERWYRLVDSDVLSLLKQGDEGTARRRFQEILGVEP
jgi:siroheme synthase-like protein